MPRISNAGPRWLAPVIACAGATLAFLWPIPSRLGREIAGPMGDNLIFYWNVWWFREALWRRHVSPFHTPMLFHPQGADLAYHTTALLATVPASFLALFLPLPVAFNLVFIGCFVFAALAMYGLALHVLQRVGQNGAGAGILAFFAAVAYAFAPFHVAHIGHLNIVNVGVVPFATWMFLRLWQVRTVRRALACGAALGLCALADGYHVLAVLLLVPLLTWLLLRHARALAAAARRPAKKPTAETMPSASAATSLGGMARFGFVALGAFLVVSSPVIVPMLKYGTRGLEDVQAGGANEYVADVVSYVAPSPFHPLWGSMLDRTYKGLSGNQAENVVFPTFTVLILAWIGWRRGGREARLWLAVAVVFAILSLGPFLHFAGRSAIPIGSDKFLRLPLPKVILDSLPLASGARAAGRFASVAQLGFVLAAMLGLSQAAGSPPRRGLLYGAVGLVIFECLAWPFPTTRIDVPAAYRAAADDARARGVHGVLLEVPPVHADDKTYQLHQTVHGMPLLGGRLARAPRHAFDRLHRDPFLDRTMSPDPWRSRDGLLSLDGLDSLGVTYVVLRPQHPHSGAIARVLEHRFELIPSAGEERLYRRRLAAPH